MVDFDRLSLWIIFVSSWFLRKVCLRGEFQSQKVIKRHKMITWLILSVYFNIPRNPLI